jgi:hypothetical protein
LRGGTDEPNASGGRVNGRQDVYQIPMAILVNYAPEAYSCNGDQWAFGLDV